MAGVAISHQTESDAVQSVSVCVCVCVCVCVGCIFSFVCVRVEGIGGVVGNGGVRGTFKKTKKQKPFILMRIEANRASDVTHWALTMVTTQNLQLPGYGCL